MYLEEIVVDNFKSFGERTRIPLEDDFTAITGPNGSGKSNILDAIQFALGLGRVSDVRARRLTDLIHHTDESEPSLPREASVTVVLNNDDGLLSTDQLTAAVGEEVIDPARIEIRRRIRQTPNNSYSYYYIDDTKVKLGDIRELMAQAGVSDDRYNIVPQGDITELINLTPMQRRLIIDEIAGVAEFDQKKEQAKAELATVKERIDEVELRIEEKTETLEQLAEEREEALAYQELVDEKAEFERYRHAAELNDREAELAEVSDRIEQLEAELADERRDLATAEERATRIEEDIEDLTEEIERKGGEEQRELQQEIESYRSEIGQLQGRIEEKRARIESLRDDRRDAELKIDRKEEALEDLEANRRDRKVDKADKRGDLVDLKEELAEVQASIDALDEEQRRLNDRLTRQEMVQDEAQETKDDLQRRLDRLNDQARRRDREHDELTTAIEEIDELIEERQRERDEIDREMDRVRDARKECQAAIDELEDERDALQAEIDELAEDIETAKERFSDLQRQQRDTGRGQFPQPVARVLGADIDGIHGAIATLGDVEDEAHATACEAAGGGRLANVVVETSTVAQSCIDYLKRRDAGRATFLPLPEFDERPLPSLPDRTGVIDFARRLVTYDDRYAGVFSYVLGSTLVVEDMDVARSLMGEYRMVTLDGDVIEQSGAMRGGSGRETPYRFGGSKGRLERLAGRIDELESTHADLVDELDDVQETLAAKREEDRQLREDLREFESERAALVDRIEQLEGQRTTKQDQLETIAAARETTRDEIDALQTELTAATAAEEAIRATIADIKSALADTALGELTRRREELNERIDEVQSTISDIEGDLNAMALEIQSATDRIEELETTIAEAEEEIETIEGDIDGYEDEIEEHEGEIAERQAAIESLEDDLADLRAEREQRRGDLADARETVNQSRQRVNDLERELGPLRDKQETLEWEIAELRESVEPIDDDEDVPELSDVSERIAELEAEMSAMEPINQKAIDQYDRLATEVESLEADIAELDEERQAINERIDSYESEKRSAFMEAYDAINAEFKEVFRTLSGGTATLELEEEDDPFEGGLLMRAQPEDKFVGSLEQLSGGEKSLTALSLIFAIQRYRPAPFYALDEIDAFLDAANLDRIGDLLESHRDDGQFIVISHHADLLERADRIIGVSMPDDLGTSRVSGIQLAGGAPADD